MRTGTALTQVWRILEQWLFSVSLPENTKPFTGRSHQPHSCELLQTWLPVLLALFTDEA